MIRGVIFDMDGVIFDSERAGTRMLREAAMELGLPMTQEQVMQLLGCNNEKCRAAIQRWFGDQVDYEQVEKRWTELTFEHVEKHGMPLKKGMPHVLQALKAKGIKTALATSNEPVVVNFYFEHAGIDGLLDEIVTGSQVAHSKPAPDIYLEAARRLGLKPEECVGVEDSVNGVKAIRAAGMTSVMVPDMKPYTEELAPYVDLLLEDLDQLIPALKL